MLFFLYGEDIWRKDQKLKQITDKFVREVDPSRMNLIALEPQGCDEEILHNTLRAAPFLARKRMLVLKDFLLLGRKAQHEILHNALPRCGEDRIVVVSEEEGKPKTWKNPEAKAAWEYLEKNAQSEEFKPLWSAKLEAAIHAQAKAHNLALEKDAAALLAIMSQGDLGWVEKELEKLGSYTQSRHSEERSDEESHTNVCTVDDIKLLCTSEGEANIFEFLDALGNKDQKKLLRTAEEQLQETDALHLVSRATSHLRALLALKLAGEVGARALNLHPFQIKKISAQMRHWEPAQIKRFLFQLLTLEYAAKTGKSPDPQTQLTALLTQFSTH